jgi:hypothetical protein
MLRPARDVGESMSPWDLIVAAGLMIGIALAAAFVKFR